MNPSSVFRPHVYLARIFIYPFAAYQSRVRATVSANGRVTSPSSRRALPESNHNVSAMLRIWLSSTGSLMPSRVRAKRTGAASAFTKPRGGVTGLSPPAALRPSRQEPQPPQLIGQRHNIVNSRHHPRAFFVEMWRTIARGDVWRGEVCNKAKKILRGDATLQDYHKRLEDIADELGDVLWYVAVCARDCGYTLEEVAIRNVNKLAKRAENGTLKGSGDHR